MNTPPRRPAKPWRNLPKSVIFLRVTVFFIIISALAAIIVPKLIKNASTTSPASPDISSPLPETSENQITKTAPIKVYENSEVRGIFIATVMNINFPSKKGLSSDKLMAELDDIVLTVKKANLNTIYFQVRPCADSFYNSNIFPTSEYLSGEQGAPLPDGFDPLAYIIEKAHSEGLRIHAWVNPFRVTTGSPSNPKHDITALAENHPARLNPDYVIPYADGRLYFDCGNPAVRTLIADGLYEIVANYDVDGIIFDDYFYPYPTYDDNGEIASFDDIESYNKYGNALSLDDWRRENVNKTILACYNAIKGADSDCKFGIAPFGIWQNDNGENGGSDTSGLESYSAIYCDPTAWIRGKYIDYIAPQIYWEFTNKNAPYDVLVRWWNTLLDGSDVELLISHGVYHYDDWEEPENELRCQVEFARAQRSYRGSVLYGYAALKANSHGLFDEVADVFSDEIRYDPVGSNGRGLIISIPYSGSYIDGDATFVIGTSDPREPLLIDGKTVGRTKSGYFSLYLSLKEGENVFTFSHKGIERKYIINRGKQPAPSASEVIYPTLDSPAITAVTPSYEWAGSTLLPVSVTAPRGAKVTATLEGKTIILTPTLYAPYTGEYMKEVYTGSFKLSADKAEIREAGHVSFSSTFGGTTYTAESARIRILGEDARIPIEVIDDNTELKIDYDSWYYDDYTPQSAYMRDEAVFLSSGMYKLRCGGYIAADKVKEIEEEIDITTLGEAFFESDDDSTYLRIKVSENVPVNCYIEGGEFCLTVHNVKIKSAQNVSFKGNPLFSSARGENGTKDNTYKYFFTLYDTENFYGFNHYYEKGYLVVKFRNPTTLPGGDTPLKGKVIVLDAGHGGRNPGALGPLGSAEGAINESDFNIKIVLEAKKLLRALGAEVVLIRDENCEIDIPIADRLMTLIETNPDIVISVHQNSMPYTADVTRVHGCVGLYWSDAGYMLTDVIGESISTALNKADRSPTKQRLAMVRNPKFPATLVETCFITNVEEYEKMMKPDTIFVIAKAISDGVINYYKAQEKYIIHN